MDKRTPLHPLSSTIVAPQREPSNARDTALHGEPLPSSLRAHFEPLFGADFSAVRVHADAQSDAATSRLDAAAFARGDDIHFAAGRWQPESAAGQHLIAHELAHTLQQQGRGAGGVSSTASLEGEADVAADSVTAGHGVSVAAHAAAASVQRKPKAYNAKFDEGHNDVAVDTKKFKPLYVQWRTDLTDLITARCGPSAAWPDYRFVLMLAQRMVEQDGPHQKAQGNNPYNVMGEGDATPGHFRRENNQEGPSGAKKTVPADFASYKTEGTANEAYLNVLEKNWPNAYKAICTGASTKDFVEGLYPGAPHNYATAGKDEYISGVRLRARLVAADLRRIYSAYLVEYRAKVKAGGADADMNRLIVETLEKELIELDDLTDRIAADLPVNRPAPTGATP
jgi:hypothetical protein